VSASLPIIGLQHVAHYLHAMLESDAHDAQERSMPGASFVSG
jgi:hypothetical protein